MHNITQAVILSAGFGKRLKPITNSVPKVMVPIAGKPLLEHHIEQFKKHQVSEFFINLHYLPQAITDYFENGESLDVRIHYVIEPEIRGTAGGIKNFEPLLQKNFFTIYGDVFSRVNYSEMAEHYLKLHNAIGMELIGNTDHPHDSDLAEIDTRLRFIKIHQKPHKQLPKKYKSMRGIYIFNRKILDSIPKDSYYEIDHELLPKLLKQGEKIFGHETNDYLKDIGTPERYKEIQQFVEK